MTSNAAVRARKLAKPVWGIEGRTGNDYSKLFDEENTLNDSINWSFEYSYKSQGDWSNHDNYSVDIPSQSSINDSTDKIIKVYRKEEIL